MVVADSLTPLQKSIQHQVSLLCQPVSSHSSYSANKNGCEDHVTFGGERSEGADHNPKEHLLQYEDLVIGHLIEQSFLWIIWGGEENTDVIIVLLSYSVKRQP